MDYQKQINDWFSKFEHRMETGVPNIVAETASEFFKERFRTQEWDKQPWPALNPDYAKKKTRGKNRILTRTGQLQASIRPAEVTASKVVISAGNSKVPYARAHNEGMRIKGVAKVKSYTNSNFMGKGKPKKIQAHTRNYNIQFKERRFMGPSKFLNQVIIERLTKFYNS